MNECETRFVFTLPIAQVKADEAEALEAVA
jgi:hypothetical protein